MTGHGGPTSAPGSVVLAGGGTTGHVAPLLATADALRRRYPGVRVTALGTATGLESRLVPERGYALELLPRVPLPRRASPALLRLPGRLAGAVTEAGRVLERAGADVVVGFGGYVSPPAYLAARRAGVPVVVHEANTRPGVANRLGARLTRHVGTAFPTTRLPHAVHVGMPLRREISTLDRAALRDEALTRFGLRPGLPVLLVTGGSQGAARINAALAGAAPELAGAGVQVLHATGRGKAFEPALPGGAPPYVVVEYLDRMDLALAAADLVVGRAGAGTVSELTAVGLPAVYVPLPHGNGEQRLNAEPVVEAGGGVLVDDADLTPAWVREHVVPLARDRAALSGMGEAASRWGTRDGDERLVDLVERALAQASGGRS